MAGIGLTIALIKALSGGGSGGGGGTHEEPVSGSTPAITGKDGTRYICGEVSTLSITPPQTGIISVVFESGSTPTILTVPNTVVFSDGFDPTDLEANTVYEINIADGTLGVVASWA